MSAQTARLAATPNPYGTPAGPGLWRHKGWKLPNYIEQIAKGIQKSGRATTESQAIHIALGVIARWARGGGKVSPEVRAASAAALAEFEALRAASHAHSNSQEKGVPAIELVGPHGFVHGWIKIGSAAADHHIAEARKAHAEGRHADAINHLTAAIGHTGDKQDARHLTELRSEMAARAMGKTYKPKTAPAPRAPGKAPGGATGRLANAATMDKSGIAGMSDSQLKAVDKELARRAAALGHAGKLSGSHKAVRAEMKKRGINLAGGGDAVELAGAFNEALHPRVPAGSAGGGRFGSGGAAAASKGKTAPKGQMKSGPVKAGAPLTGKQMQAAQLRAKAKQLRQQASALDDQAAIIAKAHPTSAAAKAKATKAAAAKATKKNVPVKHRTTTVKRKASVSYSKQITSLRTRASVLRGRADVLDIKAKQILLSGDAKAVELSLARMPKVRGAADVRMSRQGPGAVTAMHRSTGMKIGTVTKNPGGDWQATHSTGRKMPPVPTMAASVSGLIGMHNKMAASAPSMTPAAKTYTAPGGSAVNLAVPAVTAMDGPRMTSMAGGKPPAEAPVMTAAVRKFYEALLAKGMKPARAMALAKRMVARSQKAA